MNTQFRWIEAFVVAVLLCFWTGCSTTKVAQQPEGPVFFPPPPAEPRLQFLTSYSSEADLNPSSSSKFASFVLGAAPPEKPVIKPYGLALHEGKILVCDTIANSVEILDLKARRLSYLNSTGPGQFRKPINIEIDRDGTRYVTDTVRGQVLIFGSNDQYLGGLGGTEDMKPADVALSSNRIYVADLKGHLVRVYNKADRQPLFTIPRETKTEAKLFSPTNLALDEQGRVYVSDTGAFRVQIYDAEGGFVRSLGKQGDAPGEFVRPKGVAVDREGRIYVVDAATQVVQIFDAEGRLLLFFGEPGGSAAALSLPAKVIIDYDHVDLFRKHAASGFELEYVVLISNQYGPRKIAVYGFGRKT